MIILSFLILFIAHLLSSSSFPFPSILTDFISQEWKNLTNDNIIIQQRSRQTWSRTRGTIKKVRARLSIWLPKSKYVTTELFCCWFNLFVRFYSLTSPSLAVSRSNDLQVPSVKERIILPTRKLNRFMNHTTSYTIKNPTGELFTYTPNGKVRTLSPAWLKPIKKYPSLTFSWVFYCVCVPSSTEGDGVISQVISTA